MSGSPRILDSSALKVNLERTAVDVAIPERYAPLLEGLSRHFGLQRKAQELLIELNHPFVNWEHVLAELKAMAIGEFHTIDAHEEGLEALAVLTGIFVEIIRSDAREEIREDAVHGLFDCLDALLAPGGRQEANEPLALAVAGNLHELAGQLPEIFVKASAYTKRIVQDLQRRQTSPPVPILLRLLFRTLGNTYRFWLDRPDPVEWLSGEPGGLHQEAAPAKAFLEAVAPIGHGQIQALMARLASIEGKPQDIPLESLLEDSLALPDFFQIANAYLRTADQMESLAGDDAQGRLAKMDFLFHAIRSPWLNAIHSQALREINRCLKTVLQEETPEKPDELIRRIFHLLQRSGVRNRHRGAVMDCIKTLAVEVFDCANHALVNAFLEELIAFGFEGPERKGPSAYWQVQANPGHIMNLRAWLDIIAMKPRWTKPLLSALIVNLKLGGLFVRDTDLIQKEISALLASDIGPAYNLVKQLLRLFPVYHNEIGAEGELRDISTRVDDLSDRRDRVVNFLRKQSHVDSNSLLVGFMEDIFRYWASGDKTRLRDHLPEEVYEPISAEGDLFNDMHRAFSVIMAEAGNHPSRLLGWDRPRIQKALQGVKRMKERDRERTQLMIRLYQLLTKKYSPQYVDLLHDLEQSGVMAKGDMGSLRQALARGHHYKSLILVLKCLSVLKARILDPKPLQYEENIYYKRHVAADIPSMYGTYREEKFDALGLSLRLESLGTMLFEEMAASLNLKFITKRTIIRIHSYLWLFIKALELEGISIEGLVSRLKYVTSSLPVKQFSIDQYLDIFRFLSKGIQDIIRDYYIDAYTPCLAQIVDQIETRSPGGDTGVDEEKIYQRSESFLRAMITSAFGLQTLDSFVKSVIDTLSAEREKFKENKNILNLVMAYNPELAVSPLYRKGSKLDNQIYLGNKGYFLKELISYGFRVPPGFIITTEVFRNYEAVYGYKYIFKDLATRVNREIAKLEKITGRRFGDRSNPLLLSVRSGATISLPGMMQSFLNVGINGEIAAGLSRTPAFRWAAWDSYRRLLQSWGMFQGINRDFFDRLMETHKRRYNVLKKIRFRPEEMRELALAYRQGLADYRIDIPDAPLEQLRQAIQKVFESWHSTQARLYRRQMQLSDEWGTAVIVQAMVFGNLNEHSGSGVIFTRDPKGSSLDAMPYGDFIFGVQGHDIVSGLVETYPISEKQRLGQPRESDISLEARFPEIYRELVRISEVLIYEKGLNHQEIEFTFEGPSPEDLYILQTRDMVQIRTERAQRFRFTSELQSSLLGMGIGVSGGALSGRVVYTEKDIRRFRKAEPETSLILVRPDTVPDDVGMLLQVEGLLTAKGGATSHAAVTIPQLDKVGVVGFSKLKVHETEGWAVVDGQTIRAGDWIAVDGWSGSVYLGRHERSGPAEPRGGKR